MVLYLIIFFIFGLILGSFYNVVGCRLPKGESILNPPSHCPACGHRLRPLELIPIFSYIFLKGKCKNCGSQIPLFYPLIELSTGILFAVSFYSYQFTWELIICLSLVSLLMIIIVSDLNYFIINDSVLIVTSIIILIVKLLDSSWLGMLRSLGGGILLFSVMYIIMLMGNFIFKKESLGGGDVKLMFVGGLVLHPILGLFSIFLSSFIALIPAVILYYKSKEHVIPFGPFILFSILVLYLMKIDIATIYNFISMI